MLIRSRVNERIVSRRPSFLPFLGLDSFMKFPVAVSVCVVYCYPLRRPRRSPLCSGWCVDNYCRAKLFPLPSAAICFNPLSLLPRSDFARYGKFVKCGGEKRKGAEMFSPPLSSTLSVLFWLLLFEIYSPSESIKPRSSRSATRIVFWWRG